MKKIAVILSGCGFQDGSEIHESVLTLLELDNQGLEYQCLAPNITQTKVFDHFAKQDETSLRMVLSESGRIARCNILDIKNCDAQDFAGMIFPGGFGAANTLSNFATDITNYSVQNDVLLFAKNIAKQNKPAGFICIAPCLIPAIYEKSIKLTIGNDKNTANSLENLGCTHIECDVKNIVVDQHNNVVTTPAYMLGQTIGDVAIGIKKLVSKIKELI